MPSKAEVKAQLVHRLATLLPQLKIEELEADKLFQGTAFDFVATVSVRGVRKILLGEVKSSGQPRYLRQAILELQESSVAGDGTYFVIVAPYLSQQGLKICQRHQVGCVDLVGNCYLEFDGVYIERIVEENPEPARRAIKSLFTPVASRIVRAVLEEPDRTWKLTELAEATGASLGQTYNVSEKLAAEGYAHKSAREGLTLINPGRLLEAWSQAYDVAAVNQVFSFYSPEQEANRLMARVKETAERLEARYAFTLHAGLSLLQSATPEMPFGDVHFYAESNAATWADALDLQPVEFGGNVHLLRPYDEGVFYRSRTIQGLVVVGDIQLYLDLYSDPARGRERAQRLREKEICF